MVVFLVVDTVYWNGICQIWVWVRGDEKNINIPIIEINKWHYQCILKQLVMDTAPLNRIVLNWWWCETSEQLARSFQMTIILWFSHICLWLWLHLEYITPYCLVIFNKLFISLDIWSIIFNPRPLRPKGYCRHLRLSVCPSVRLSVCLSVCSHHPC